jgi:hypothetical protein
MQELIIQGEFLEDYVEVVLEEYVEKDFTANKVNAMRISQK